MIKKIKIMVIPATSSDEELLPLTAVVPKELLPLRGIPVVEQMMEEADLPEEVVFVTTPEKKMVFEHFSKLKEYGYEKYTSSFFHILQKKSTSEADTVSRAEKRVGGEPFMLSFADNILFSNTPLFAQLFSVFRTSEKSVLALSFNKEVNSSHVAEVEKIASRLYKIKKIRERSEENEDMPAVVCKGIFNASVFDYLKGAKKESSVMDVVAQMLSDGKTVYAYEVDGQWVNLHNYESYTKEK